MNHTPRDPEFESRVRESFSRQKVMGTFGATIAELSPGHVCIHMPFRQELTQQHGFLHAGVISTLLDSACGYAALSLMPAGAGVLAVEYKINLLSPGRGDEFVARATVRKAGRTLTTCTADAFAIESGSEKLVATMLATMMSVTGRDIVD